jgi:hypothetical protein
VLAVVEIQIADRDRELAAAGAVLGEQLAKVLRADLIVMTG